MRIAVLGNGPPPTWGSPDVEVVRVAPGTPIEEVLRADGVWLAPAGPEIEPVVHGARRAGVPLGWSGTPPEWVPAFLDAARARAAATAPRPYVHQMRGPGYRWWRPVLALLVGAVTTVGLFVAIGVPLAVLGVAPTVEELTTTPLGSLVGNLSIAALGVGGLVGVGVGFWRSPGRVLSVAGRVRWRWLLLCHAVVLPIWVAYLAVSWVVFDQEVLPRPEAWVGLVVVSLLTTPLQAAAEEVFFRGALVQTLGAWFRSPVVAFAVTTPVSVAAFAAAHGSADPWIVAELSSLAVLGAWLTWRTGGLEAAIALHVVNNVLVTLSGALLGGLSESYIDGETTGSPLSAGISWAVTLLASALLLRLARGRGLAPPGRTAPALG